MPDGSGKEAQAARTLVLLEAGIGVNLAEFLAGGDVAEGELEICLLDGFTDNKLVGVRGRDGRAGGAADGRAGADADARILCKEGLPETG